MIICKITKNEEIKNFLGSFGVSFSASICSFAQDVVCICVSAVCLNDLKKKKCLQLCDSVFFS